MLRLIFVINLEANFSNICVWQDQFWGELNWDLTAEFFLEELKFPSCYSILVAYFGVVHLLSGLRVWGNYIQHVGFEIKKT